MASTTVTTWNIDPAHSAAAFKVRHMMISHVKGEFRGLSGVVKLDDTDSSRSTVEVSIPAEGIKTGDEARDGHLKAADFLDVEKFPTITFKSTSITSTGKSNYAVTGDLTIHGVTKSVTLTVEDVSNPTKDPYGNERIGLTASTKIERKDFGLVWNGVMESGGVLVGDEVTITIDAELIKA